MTRPTKPAAATVKVVPNKILVVFIADVVDEAGHKLDELQIAHPIGPVVPGQPPPPSEPFTCFSMGKGRYRIAGSSKEELPALEDRIMREATAQQNAQTSA